MSVCDCSVLNDATLLRYFGSEIERHWSFLQSTAYLPKEEEKVTYFDSTEFKGNLRFAFVHSG